MLLTKEFTPDQFVRGLESWSWLDIADKTPLLSSLFGDVFFVAADGYWFLDTMEGTLQRRWDDRDQLQSVLDSEDGQDEFLLGGIAMAADRAGMILRPDEVYQWVIPPLLGGDVAVSNLTQSDFVVVLNICGQLVRQVKDMPPGTKISGFTVDGQHPTE